MKSYKFLGIMVAMMAIISNGVFAQAKEGAQVKGIDQKVLINAGVGYILNVLGGMPGKVKVPPVSVSADFALPKLPVTIGGTFIYAQNEENWDGEIWGGSNYKTKYHDIGFGVRGMYHFVNFVKNWDVYVGPTLGYVIQKTEVSGDSSSESSTDGSYFLWGVSVGARYFFTKNIGAYSELGVRSVQKEGISSGLSLSAGLALKF